MRRMFLLMLAPLLILAADTRPASSTQLSFTCTNSGALTPWAGQVDGSIDIIGYTVQGTTRIWTREGSLVATPPIPSENWFPALTRGHQAMYQLIKFIIDRFSYDSSPLTTLGQATGNTFAVSLTAYNDQYGILISCEAVSNGADDLVTGAIHVHVEEAFPYCTNAYFATETMVPDGPGRAVFGGNVRMDLQDGSILDLTLEGEVTFDEDAELPFALETVEVAEYEISEEPEQVLTVVETYSERPSGEVPGTVVTLAGTRSGQAVEPWEGMISGYISASGHVLQDDIQSWTRVADLVAQPPFPAVDGDRSIHHLFDWVICKFIGDLSSALGDPVHPSQLGGLTDNDYQVAMTAGNPDTGVFIDLTATITPGNPVQTEGDFALTIDVPSPIVLDSYTSSGQVQPAGFGSAVGDGVVQIGLEDGTFLELPVQMTFFFAPHLELPSPYEFTEEAGFTLYEHTDQVLHVVEIYTERVIDVTAGPPAATPVSPLRLWTYPNPFNPRATIAFELAEPQTIVLTVHQVDGARVATLLSGLQPAGRQEVVWDGLDAVGRPVASGVYLARIFTGDAWRTQRMVMVR